MNDFKVRFLGTRGSIAADGKEFAGFGGATTCLLVSAGGQSIFIDAGSGLMHAEAFLRAAPRRFAVLMTHAHLDHICGLPMFGPALRGDWAVDMFGRTRGGMDIRAQVGAMMSPPLWPVKPEALRNVRFHELPDNGLDLGDVRVTFAETCHPGGCTAYKLAYGGRSAVFAFDHEHGTDADAGLADLARGCDLLVWDGNFADKEYGGFRGWGHSTPLEGGRFAFRAGVKRVLVAHFNAACTDGELAAQERDVAAVWPNVSFARQMREYEV